MPGRVEWVWEDRRGPGKTEGDPGWKPYAQGPSPRREAPRDPDHPIGNPSLPAPQSSRALSAGFRRLVFCFHGLG